MGGVHMSIKNTKIGTQLKTGFAFLLILVILMGIVSYSQTAQLFNRAETLYRHPLQIRSSIGLLNADILNARLAYRDLLLASDTDGQLTALQDIQLYDSDAELQFDVLRSQYLGPGSDVDNAYNSFLIWKVSRDQNIQLVLSVDTAAGIAGLAPGGETSIDAQQMMSDLKVIDEFARNKADALYADYVRLDNSLKVQLYAIIAASVALAAIISIVLLRNIRKPLQELSNAARRFHQGDLDARSTYQYSNEFGELSASFNLMLEQIKTETVLTQKTGKIITAMLSEEESRKFFRILLQEIAANTGSQMAAVYLPREDNEVFEYYESVGLSVSAKDSFDAGKLEGEFGAAVASHKIQHLRNISKESSFIFHTVGGSFIPCEIITIPVLSGEQVIAVISLGSLSPYDQFAIPLIENTLHTMAARIGGILANRRIKQILKQMEQQNRELDAQKSELSAQKAELTQQNVELEAQKNQLFEASRLKTNFLSNMSHELRTPLNSVIALSGVLNRRLSGVISEEEYSYLEIIERNGKNLLMLINDILDISRIEAGREEIDISRFNAKDLIEDVVNLIQPQAHQKNIELIYTASDFDLYLTSDSDKFRHVLQNLIGNAVKFTQDGKVEIYALISEDRLSVSIADTGIGIAEEHLAHIFDEFRQADGSTSRRFGGTGLGLSIARKYANLLGGDISVKSTIDVGSEFTLDLPIHYSSDSLTADDGKLNFYKPIQHVHTIRSEPALRPLSEAAAKTILLVEDSEPAIIQMKDLLEECGYMILSARNAAEAFEVISQFIPDAMILDLMMPEIDGFSVLEKIRNADLTAHIPVLILTAKHITKEELKFLKRNNVHQLIQKGDVNRADLQNAVAGMLFPEPEPAKMALRSLQKIEGKPTILLVEDNIDNMITAKAILAGRYTILEAADGYMAVQKAKESLPHLVLMDISLPGIDGIEAFKIIRSFPQTQHIPIVALTASAMLQDRETILAHGFDGFIAKPINEAVLFSGIDEVLYGK